MYVSYHPSFNHPVPEHHRFPMQKYDDVFQSIMYSDIRSHISVLTPELCPIDIIELAHDRKYIDSLLHRELDAAHIRRIGFQLDDLIIERERYIMDGTLQVSIKAAQESSYGFNIAGGTHHAFSDRGEGFCIFNDFAISAAYLIEKRLSEKVLIIDCDVHQGNGTAQIFRHQPHVFTFSMHGKNNFPFVKENSDLDIELEDGSDDDKYLSYLQQSLDFIDKIFHADFIFYQCGVDILSTDKMGKLKVSSQGCQKRDEIVYQYARSKKIPIVSALGGGYSTSLEDIVSQHVKTIHTAHQILH